MEIRLNLLRMEGYSDGKEHYVGMYDTNVDGMLNGGPELTNYSNLNKMFDELRECFGGEVDVMVRSEELPSELKKVAWFKERVPISQSELLAIIDSQKTRGHNVELVA